MSQRMKGAPDPDDHEGWKAFDKANRRKDAWLFGLLGGVVIGILAWGLLGFTSTGFIVGVLAGVCGGLGIKQWNEVQNHKLHGDSL